MRVTLLQNDLSAEVIFKQLLNYLIGNENLLMKLHN